jgi:outer membrane receptor protein involved in Fe transport
MPPPEWPLAPAAVPANTLPARFEFRNLAQTQQNKGIEISLQQRLSSRIHVYANYSYQADPQILDAPANTIPASNFPPHHRFNSGFNFNSSRLFGGIFLTTRAALSGSMFWMRGFGVRRSHF